MGKKKGAKKNTAKGKNKKTSKKRKILITEPEVIEPPTPPLSQGEFICLHIGQAGVQVGSACWELFCLEHGINPDGTVKQLKSSSTSMFSVSEANTYTLRALLIDTEPFAIDSVRNGDYRNLFTPRNMISGKENAGNNYAAGFYGVGKTLSLEVIDQLRRLAEDCNSLQGIALFRSIGGGTGSGMGSKLIEMIKNAYPKISIVDFNICPSPELSPVIVEPYNAMLATNYALDIVNCSLLFDNKSLYKICNTKLGIPKPTYGNINRVIATVSSGITSSLRFEGSMTSNLSDLLTSLMPQPRLHYPLITHVPIQNAISGTTLACTQLAVMSFDHSNQTVKVDPRKGKYLSVCMMFRGDMKPTEINTSIAFIQREHTLPLTQNMNSPLFKFGLCYQPLATVPSSGIEAYPRAVTTLCNNTAIKNYWKNMMSNYNKMLGKRAFVHHYTAEGMDEEMFDTTSKNVSKLISEYEEIENF